MKRILLTGKNGQVGWELQRTLAPLGEVLAFDHAGLDLADPDRIVAVIREQKPHVIVNAAAYTAVDRAESEPAAATAINTTAPGILAAEARRSGALLVHYSTDYVFNGRRAGAYSESDTPDPLNVYGRSKLGGEQSIAASGCRHLTLRTSWVYGNRGQNFLGTILRLAAERETLSIVDDQHGAPTWSRLIAEATALMLAQDQPAEGLFHLASAGATTWFGFARAIVDRTANARERAPRLTPCTTAQYPLPATRPQNSQLDCSRLTAETGLALPDWQTALELCLADR